MKKLIFCFLLILPVSLLMAQTSIIAHRGASFLAPENTVVAAKLAWELGADAVEIDVHLSKDKRVMVNHDKTTHKTGGKNFLVKNTSSADLRKLDVGKWKSDEYAGEKIPFVEEVIETVPSGKTLVIEIKCGSEVLPALKKAVETSDKLNQIVFISFGWKTIVDTKAMFPKNACYWLSGTGIGLNKRMKQSAEIGLDGVNLKYSVINEKVMKRAEKLELDVLSWTIDDPKEAARLINLGVSGITTNRPAWLKEQLNR